LRGGRRFEAAVIAVTRLLLTRADKPRMIERRIKTVFPAVFQTHGRGGKGEVRNVSNGGLFVRTALPPDEGSAVSIRLTPPGKVPVEVSGLVWWRTDATLVGTGRSGFGLRILNDDEAYHRLVASLG
jgi:hypothetical protein